ncbi:hypothetical protein M0805_002094 [Coniferiporia weirii]|nr:hypothetical protein M0805_002094 [Coniferiporia weirii]
MSVFTRIWNLIRRPTSYVGKDLEGNYFYEYASTTSDPRRTRRVIKYNGKTDMLEVANRNRQLAVQWKAWLTHTRLHPPSIEELQTDVARRERLAHNVALLEARDREERIRLASADNAQHVIAELDTGTARSRNPDGPRSHEEAKRGAPEPEQSPWIPRPPSDEPQPWAPNAARRGE